MDSPPQNLFSFEPESPHWQASQGDSFGYLASDNSAQESWTEFMSWDPMNVQSSSMGHQSTNVGAHTELARSPGSRRNTQTRPVLLGLDTGTGLDPAAAGDNHSAFTFGTDATHSSSFDFEFDALHSAEDVAGYTSHDYTTPHRTNVNHLEALTSAFPSPAESHGHINVANMLSGSSISSRASNGHSPVSLPGSHATPPSSNASDTSPQPPANSGRKRKTADASIENDRPSRKTTKEPPIKKTAHNMIEKRYRNKLNDKIEELKNSVPSLKRLSTAGLADDNDDEDLDGLTPAHKTNKATVLSKATEYIKHLEKRNKQLMREMQSMKREMEKVKKLALSATMQSSNVAASSDASRYPEDSFPTGAGPATPNGAMPSQGMIPVPESMMNLHGSAAGQAHYAHQYSSYANPQHNNAAPQPMVRMRGGQALNKMMVGALAGLMIVEGLHEREESGEEPEGRGLFAFPMHMFSRSSSDFLHYTGSRSGESFLLPLFKAVTLIGALLYLIIPLLNLKPKSKKDQRSPIRLTTVPSVASPIEVRQRAWLTAAQTVWIPQHKLSHELFAIALKTIELSTRRLIGWNAYAMLTGTTKEQEQARVNAWKTAIDAQLTGGDAEISIRRLKLTILASGTLPDTPARLMLKSLHIRVLLWEVVSAGYSNWFAFDNMCAMLARQYWNAARTMHQLGIKSDPESKDATSANQDAEREPLPDHLAALLEMECDDVLNDIIIQRAYNLAWNRPSQPDDSMDGVVEDFGISSPLDALAAWYSCYTTRKALSSSLSGITIPATDKAVEDIDRAVNIAPPASSAYIRALAARAILVQDDREASIAAAMSALPSVTSGSDILENAVTATPVPNDVKLALTLAKCLSLLYASTSRPDYAAAAKARAVSIISAQQISRGPWTLLGFAAAYKVMNAFAADKVLVMQEGSVRWGLERLAGALRLWVGRVEGEKLALGRTRGMVVERCLAVRKEASGVRDEEERESGYGSAED